jgi:hypothetical protein
MQVDPERTNPDLQVKSHATPLQTASAFAGKTHGEQELPHELTLVLLTHWPAQR